MNIKNLFKKITKNSDEIVVKTVVTNSQMLKEIMCLKNIDQQRLANLLEVDKAQITRWLNGAIPKMENQKKIKALYDKTMKENEVV